MLKVFLDVLLLINPCIKLRIVYQVLSDQGTEETERGKGEEANCVRCHHGNGSQRLVWNWLYSHTRTGAI